MSKMNNDFPPPMKMPSSDSNSRDSLDFLRKQVDKLMADIEKLKDANRDLGYKNGQ